MKKIILIVFSALLLITSFSCKKRFDDLNESPNNPANAPSQMMIANVIATTAYRIQLSAGLVITDEWVQHIKATTYMDEDTYNPRNDRMDGIWAALYNVAFEDCIQAQKAAVKDGLPNNEAIALVLKSYVGYNLTMLWGDVPYSQAGQGGDGIITPPYDTQLDIFNSLLADLNTAISKMNMSTPAGVGELNQYDLLYGGDMSKWSKFANSLKLRIYLSMTAGGVSKTAEINALLAGSEIFQSSDDEAKLIYQTSGNPVYQWVNPTSSRRDDFRVTATLVNYMMGSSTDSTAPADPRLAFYANPLANGNYVGGTNGSTGGISTNSSLGTGFYNYNAPFYFMSYSEILFIKAEMNPTQTNYEDAVKAACVQVDPTLDATTMLTDPKFAFSAGTALQLIGEQKWVSLYGQGVEAYNCWRRTGFPKLTPANNAATDNGFVPRRLKYNTDERNLNLTNLNAGTLGLTPATDVISSKAWFDRLHVDNFGNN
jgi:hypothetical protein